MEQPPDIFTLSLRAEAAISICDFLAQHCPLSKVKIKDALAKGAVVLTRVGQKQKRIRKATFGLHIGDCIGFHYNRHILQSPPQHPTLLYHHQYYSIWYKPPGMLTQGTEFGDHNSLIRQVELHYQSRKNIKIVHRLDKDACGILLVAHEKKSAALLSQLFSSHKVSKKYIAYTEGCVGAVGTVMKLTGSIGGKQARTVIKVVSNAEHSSELEIDLYTGRKHQIRRHLHDLGFPICGDKVYGSNYSKNENMKLLAFQLSFICPFSKTWQHFTVPQDIMRQFRKRL